MVRFLCLNIKPNHHNFLVLMSSLIELDTRAVTKYLEETVSYGEETRAIPAAVIERLRSTVPVAVTHMFNEVFRKINAMFMEPSGE